jgi:ferrochelatase
MDKYVIDVPFLLRALLVRGIILQTRPKNPPQLTVWTDEGSPLIVLSKMHAKVKELDVPFTSYALWKPFSLSGLQELHDQGVTEVMLFSRNMLWHLHNNIRIS